MSTREHWADGARQAHEEMSGLVAAGATPDELHQITARLMAAHGDNAATAGDQARAAGYLEMTASITEQELYRQDAEADHEAGM